MTENTPLDEFCPVCGSEDLETIETEKTQDNRLILKIECQECSANWFLVYEFVANENEFGDFI